MKIDFLNRITKTLRGRLFLWYLITTGIILLVFSSAISILFSITLQNQIDHHLHIAINEAHQIVQNYHGNERESLIKNLVSAQGMTVVVLSPDGAPVLETNSPDIALVTEHQLQKVLASTKLYETSPVHFTQSEIRFAAMPVQVDAGKGIVAVGYSTKILNNSFYILLALISATVIFLVLPIAFIGYKFIHRQLNPLESIVHQAGSVAKDSIFRRIHLSSAASEELQVIRNALNSMLGKLEKVFAGEQQFFSDAAHTLKTPLAVLRSQIETLSLSQKTKKELLGTIDSTNDTIQDLLLLSKISGQSKDKAKIDLSSLIDDLYELASVLGEDKHLQIAKEVESNIYINADRSLLNRALSNLVHNAVSYTPQSGSIELNLRRSRNNIIFTVKDTGIGISRRDLLKVFTRFFRGTNVSGSGSGLGLAISKAVIESFGGRISLSSSLGKGTIVTVSIPS